MSTNEDKEVGCAEPNARLADHVYAGDENNESNITFHSESVSEIHDDTRLVSNLGSLIFKLFKLSLVSYFILFM
jgi:hypothetical protein